MESKVQVFDKYKSNSWTRKTKRNVAVEESDEVDTDLEIDENEGNKLDQVSVKTPPGVICKVELTAVDEYDVSFDHERFYIIKLYESSTTDEYQLCEYESEFEYVCESCSRGYKVEGLIHDPCPNINEEDIAEIYFAEQITRSKKEADKNLALKEEARFVSDRLEKEGITNGEIENIESCLKIYRLAINLGKGSTIKKGPLIKPRWATEVFNWDKTNFNFKSRLYRTDMETTAFKQKQAEWYDTKK